MAPTRADTVIVWTVLARDQTCRCVSIWYCAAAWILWSYSKHTPVRRNLGRCISRCVIWVAIAKGTHSRIHKNEHINTYIRIPSHEHICERLPTQVGTRCPMRMRTYLRICYAYGQAYMCGLVCTTFTCPNECIHRHVSTNNGFHSCVGSPF